MVECGLGATSPRSTNSFTRILTKMSQPESLSYTVGTYDWLTYMFNAMPDADGCARNCSGQGTCQNGQCICLVQFAGGSCQDMNVGYFRAFGSIFVCLSFVAIVQLFLCIRNEYIKQKNKSVKRALCLSAQKLLYVLTIFATAIRGIYFFTKWHISDSASSNLWSAYYPVLLSGFSFLVCFWAEAFHLSNIPHGKPRFLSKSIIGFTVFNVLVYTLLLCQLILTEVLDDPHTLDFILKISNGCFAGMIILAVVFFLIYGIEVYFKVHGAFTLENCNVDPWQLHMSRLGLIAQALLQLIIATFLLLEVTKEVWKDRLPILSQNFYDIVFRIVEFGVVLWFPCVLWNYKSPENLWVLNPKRLFKPYDLHESNETDRLHNSKYQNYGTLYHEQGMKLDCWICYDTERNDAGPLIRPCHCKGDVATVHHECLRKWLMECVDNKSDLRCKVCNVKYKMKESWVWTPKAINTKHWMQTFISLFAIVGSPFAAYAITHSITSLYGQIFTIGICVLTELTFCRLLANSIGPCYKRGRLSTVTIVGEPVRAIKSNQILPVDTQTDSYPQNVHHTSPKIDIEHGGPPRLQDTHAPRCSEEDNARSNSISVEAVIETNRSVN